MRNPLKISTLQGVSLILMFWFGLAFCGVDGLVPALRPDRGPWFWVFAAVWMMLPTLYVMDLFRYRNTKYFAITLGLFWALVQYAHHLHAMFFPSPQDYIDAYYAYYDTTYLFGPFDDRVVPDVYHIFLDFMILALNWIGIKRVLVRAYNDY